MLSINSNIPALSVQNNLDQISGQLQGVYEKLSSGKRVNSAADDAAGLAVADRMTAQIRGMNQAARNASNGISLLQTSEGALQETTDMLQRMRELAVQAANSTNTESDRESLNQEYQKLLEEVDRLASSTTFNGQPPLNGDLGKVHFQVGPNVGDIISVDLGKSMEADAIGGYAETRLDLQGDPELGETDPAAFRHYQNGDWTINGFNINEIGKQAEDHGRGPGSAYALARAINAKTDATGVTAQAEAARAQFDNVAQANLTDGTYELTINGETIFTQQNAGSISADALAERINDRQGVTGVEAKVDDSGHFTLVAPDGRNIQIEETIRNGQGTTYFGKSLSDASGNQIYKGGLELRSGRDIEIETGNVPNGGDPRQGLLVSGREARWSEQTRATHLASTGVDSAAKAEGAIRKIDQAIDEVDSYRAHMGALQNRLESSISNLRNAARNLTEARSRIMDADLAKQTAQLAQLQTRQQGAVAMLGQANMQPTIALELLSDATG
jgi:flagellin